jgi:hypothetical protein
MKQLNISIIRDFFEELVNLDKHSAGIVIDVNLKELYILIILFN